MKLSRKAKRLARSLRSHRVRQQKFIRSLPKTPRHQRDREISAWITEYLSAGGLFNPELMDHQTVRDGLIEIREHLDQKPWINGIHPLNRIIKSEAPPQNSP